MEMYWRKTSLIWYFAPHKGLIFLLTKHAQQHWCASPSIQYSTLYPIKWNGRFRVVTPRINFPEIIKRTRVGSVSSEMRSVERVANLPQQPENSAETREKQQEHRSFAVWGQRFMWLSLIVKLFHCFHTRPGARNWRIKFPAPQNFHGEFICEARSRGQKETWLNGVMKGRWWKRLVYRC